MAQFDPDWTVCPGETLREWAEHHEMPVNQMACQVGVTPNHVRRIYHGRAVFSPELAVRFGTVTGIPARFLFRLQADWLIDKALGKKEM